MHIIVNKLVYNSIVRPLKRMDHKLNIPILQMLSGILQKLGAHPYLPGLAEIIAPVGGPGNDVISHVKWSVTPQKAIKRWHRLYFLILTKKKPNLDLLGAFKGWSIFAYGFYNPFNESISRTPPTHPPILS